MVECGIMVIPDHSSLTVKIFGQVQIGPTTQKPFNQPISVLDGFSSFIFIYERDPFEFPSVPQSFDISVSPMSTPAQKPNPSHNTGKTRSSELEPVNIMWKDPQQEIPSKFTMYLHIKS